MSDVIENSEQPTELKGLPPLDQRERRKRKREYIAIGFLAILFTGLTIAEFRLTRVSTTLPFVNSIFFFGLLNLNIITLIILIWLVFRNMGKLIIERRRKVLGAKLKTKLVMSFLGLSVVPTLVLFVISALYINSSFDKWFSIKIQNTLQSSLDITRVYYKAADERASHFAQHIADGIRKRYSSADLLDPFSKQVVPNWISEFLELQRELLAVDAVEYYTDLFDERHVVTQNAEGNYSVEYPRASFELLERAFSGEQVSTIQQVGTGDLIRCFSPIKLGDKVVSVIAVSTYIPVSLVNKVDEIASVFDDYKDTNPLRYPIKTFYLLLLISITILIIFVAIWIGFRLAKELTVPVERLVYGAQAVGSGNLDVTITGTGHDEISVLVQSFNKMTADLRENRASLVQASADLEKRRLQLETVLANVGTGVIVVDQFGRIITYNRAVAQLLGIAPDQALNKNFREALGPEMAPLNEVIHRSFDVAIPAAEAPELAQWSFKRGELIHTLMAVATPLKDSPESKPWGVVTVIDDMTHLIKAQREMAWREVARRIAHEIKNPLTPIKLSAQRLQRRLSHIRGRDASLLQECTDVIIQHADEMKEMVNEFSNFARFPEVTPALNNLNVALKEVGKLYDQAHPQVHFKFALDTKLKEFEFDRDQMKRVVINLLDNAVAALRQVPAGRVAQVTLETHYNEKLEIAVIIVKDNGPGMDEEVKSRMFEPYFSTKKEGTGLGLAIAKRIVNDHNGFIRVQSTLGEGTTFMIELPTKAT